MNAKSKERLKYGSAGFLAAIILTHWSTVAACLHVIATTHGTGA